MKLELTQIGESGAESFIKFNDNLIKETVGFWANIKYQSPQFPVDFTPNINQLGTLYDHGNIPQISTQHSTEFKVTPDILDDYSINIVQLKLTFIGPTDSGIPSEEDWNQCFDTGSNTWVFTPDGSAYIAPTSPGNTILIDVNSQEASAPKYFSYCVLVSFEINDKTYYGNFDPYVKVTSSSTNA